MMLKLAVAWNFTNQSILIKKSLTEIVVEKMNRFVHLETREMTEVQEMTAGANLQL